VAPCMGELLFPSFNLIVPQMVEFVLPSLPLLPSEAHQSQLLQTFYSLISFAFKTQIYEKRIPSLIHPAKAA
jgi:hypothetical protein